MEMAVAPINAKRNVKLKQIALPTEHGSWGFLFEPLLAGILIAPSIASIWFAVLLIGAFLTRQPLKIYLNDLQAKRNLPQTEASLKFILIFGSIFSIGLLGSLYFAKAESFYPFLLILPLGFYQIYCDASKKSRQLLPELTGAIAISSSIAAVTIAGGFDWTTSLALWTVFICRLIPSILYVRNRLKLEKGKAYSVVSVAVTNFLAFAVVGLLAVNGLIPKLPTAMFFILMIRSVLGLSSYRKRIKAMRIGVWEVIYGTLTALSVVLGYYFQI
jgi:hypothetical protein